jgi:tetratricopeptide (TPR) repeat protein
MSVYEAAPKRSALRTFIIPHALLCCTLLVYAAGEQQDRRASALTLYGEGKYEQALPLLQALDAAGAADGALLYRLYFCQRHAKDPAARTTQERARVQLEKEYADSPDLEAPFYLANVYRNVGRLADMRRVAAEAISRIENGSLPQPATGVEMFRLGKMYADIDRKEEAAGWYSRAVEMLDDGEAVSAPPYIAWAARQIAVWALSKEDYAVAAEYYALLPMGTKDSLPDLDSMATASCRAGMYAQAKEAWLQAERLDPANANRFRYSRHLAAMAEELGRLPMNAPDGRTWQELSKEELQSEMIERVSAVREVVASGREAEALVRGVDMAATEALGPSESLKKFKIQLRRLRGMLLQNLQAEIDLAKPDFVAAGLEITINRYGIRETAFFGGYAPLIFNKEQWSLERQVRLTREEARAAAAQASFGEQAEKLLLVLRQSLDEKGEIRKLEKMLSKLEKKIG